MAKVQRRLGLTMRTQQAEGYDEPRDALAQAWARFLAVALPESNWMYLPNVGADRIGDYCARWEINGLILTGGEDPGTSPLRDETETALLGWAKDNDLPLLGICRGLQVMTVDAGGTLQDTDGHVAVRHPLRGRYSHDVNSYHTRGLQDCPPGYTALARAEDGSIEAIGHTDLNWEGWMWHPEREPEVSSHDTDAIQRIFS